MFIAKFRVSCLRTVALCCGGDCFDSVSSHEIDPTLRVEIPTFTSFEVLY